MHTALSATDCWLLGALVAMHQGGAGLEQLFVEWADGHVVVKFHKNVSS